MKYNWSVGFRSLSIYFAAFLSGFLTMALEMLIGRTFIPYFGGTIYTWGALISIFLTGMTFGYVVGGRFADRRPAAFTIGILFLASAVFVVVIPFFGENMINNILNQIEDVRYAALVAALSMACLPAASLAAISPFCLRLLLRRSELSGTISGRLSGLATAGSIIGTLGTSFFLIPTFGMKLIYALLAGLSVFFGLNFLILGRTKVNFKSILAVLTLTSLSLAAWTARAQPSVMEKDGLLEKIDSEYNTIFVIKNGPLISLQFGYRNNQYTESILDLNRPTELVVPYTRYMTASLAYHQGDIKRIALVGLGGGRTISYLLANLPSAIADVAELDSEIIKVADKYFAVKSGQNLHILNKDGRVYLNQTKEKYDLILLDAYRGPFVPFHLTTKEFYQLIKSRLNIGGVVAQNVESTTMFYDGAFVTMKSVFDSVDILDAESNSVFIGYSGPGLSNTQLATRAAEMQKKLKTKYDLRALIKSRKDIPLFKDAKILTDDFAPVEMLKTVSKHNKKRKE